VTDLHPDPIIRRIHACVLAGVPPFLWGTPGTGKTARVFSYETMTSRHVERWLLSRVEPIDIKPRVYHDGKAVVCDAPEVERVASTRGILFFDELNLSTRETEGAALNLMDHPPSGVSIIAAGNPPSRGQAARYLGAPAANRFCHLTVESDPKAWAAGMMSGWTVEPLETLAVEREVLDAAQRKMAALVATYIRHQPGDLEAKPETTAEAGGAWASSRTWDFVSRLLAVSSVLGLPEEDVQALTCGCVGPGPGLKIAAWVDARDLPDPEALLADPTSYKPPVDRIDRILATCSAVFAAVDRELTADRWKAAWKLDNVICDAGVADGAMMFADMLQSDVFLKRARTGSLPKEIVSAAALMPKRIASMLVGVK
jgi:hypothetical protein